VLGVDLPKPELLPCGYVVGDVNSISLVLKGIPRLSVCISTQQYSRRILGKFSSLTFWPIVITGRLLKAICVAAQTNPL